MAGEKKLGEYEAKRQFDVTPEPGPEVVSGREGPLLFVIQKHAATRLHYDLRLEVDGVLKSWALPKGISYDPSVKNLAVMTEDHPFDYGSFEGVIPPNQYGSGEVIVWDCGTYWCDEDDDLPALTREEEQERIRKGFAKGKLGFTTRGHKMKGSWALIRMKDEPNWLIFKHSGAFEEWKEDPLSEEESVLSGRTILDLKRGDLPDSRRKAETLAPGTKKLETIPQKLQPMLCTLADAPFSRPGWLFEPKLDGIRSLIYLEEGKVRIITRNGLDQTSQFPELVRHLEKQPIRRAVFDGEIVAFDEGKPGFNAMLKRFHLKDALALEEADRSLPTVFYAFDLLYFEGVDLRSLPQVERKRYLAQALAPGERVQLVTHIPEDGETLYSAVLQTGFEGIVAKKADAKYDTSGKRSKCWLKIKNVLSGEFVVGGYSQGEGSRGGTFGAILVGFYEEGKLIYAGHVGSGFNEELLADFKRRLEALTQKECPFAGKPELHGPTKWVKPEIVVEVKFNEITPAGNLRAPVFVRFRDDISAKEVGPIRTVHEDSLHEGRTASSLRSAAEGEGEGGGESVGQQTERREERMSKKEDAVIQAVLAQLDSKDKNLKIQVGEHEVSITSLDKVLWPANPQMDLEPMTKRDFLRYLTRVSPYMIQHARDRPLTLIRWPEGINGEKFFQKHYDQKKPAFAETVRLYSESNDVDQEYLMLNNLPTLLWLGQMGTLEYHIWGSRCTIGPDGQDLGTTFTGSAENIEASLLNYPDYINFDIDPYIYSGKEKKGDEPELNKEAFEKGKTVAFLLKKLLDDVGLEAFVKTTGKTGLHIFVPIIRNLDFTTVRSICETFCRSLEQEHPRLITMEWSVPKRTGKIFMDFNMNVRSKTLGCAYCPRALPNQSMAMPVTWEELATVYPTDFNMRNVF
ncbi:MAG TPA: non-homologous end-joining DNA ligase, partial [Fimbriimonadaceae bacterium]|nr:non-homologous end-joining DNA ligase [Fimbriimonadaceae bacterium]